MPKILFFGELREITGCSETNIVAFDTNNLKKSIIENWPELNKKTLALALNKKLINTNTAIYESDEIAIMPPFSGG